MLAVIVYMAVLLIQQQSVINANKAKINAVNDKISQESVNQQKLQDENANALSDQTIERIAREILGMVKPGEKIYIEADN
jgi:cell division protein FtsB